MKIAILFFGQPRFISNKLASRSHKFWFARNHHVDYFGHVWIPTANQALETQRLGKYIPDPNSVESIREQYPNIALKVDAPLRPEQLVPVEWLAEDSNTNRGFLFNTVSQLTSISIVLTLVEEVAHQYDLIMLTRWDNFIWWRPPLSRFRSGKLNVANSLGLSNISKYGVADLVLVGNYDLLQATSPIPLDKSHFDDLKTEDATLWKWKSFERHHTINDLNSLNVVVSMIRSKNWTATLIKFPMESLKNKIRIRVRIANLMSFKR